MWTVFSSKAKTRKSNIVHTGLGGGMWVIWLCLIDPLESFGRLLFSFSGVNDITSNAAVGIPSLLADDFYLSSSSKKYRFSVDTSEVRRLRLADQSMAYLDEHCFCLVTDRRTYKDRRDVWAAEKKATDFVAERPKAKIKQVDASAEESSSRKNKRTAVAARPKSDENKDEELVSLSENLDEWMRRHPFLLIATTASGWRRGSCWWRTSGWRGTGSGRRTGSRRRGERRRRRRRVDSSIISTPSSFQYHQPLNQFTLK